MAEPPASLREDPPRPRSPPREVVGGPPGAPHLGWRLRGRRRRGAQSAGGGRGRVSRAAPSPHDTPWLVPAGLPSSSARRGALPVLLQASGGRRGGPPSARRPAGLRRIHRRGPGARRRAAVPAAPVPPFRGGRRRRESSGNRESPGGRERASPGNFEAAAAGVAPRSSRRPQPRRGSFGGSVLGGSFSGSVLGCPLRRPRRAGPRIPGRRQRRGASVCHGEGSCPAAGGGEGREEDRRGEKKRRAEQSRGAGRLLTLPGASAQVARRHPRPLRRRAPAPSAPLSPRLRLPRRRGDQSAGRLRRSLPLRLAAVFGAPLLPRRPPSDGGAAPLRPARPGPAAAGSPGGQRGPPAAKRRGGSRGSGGGPSSAALLRGAGALCVCVCEGRGGEEAPPRLAAAGSPRVACGRLGARGG